MKIINTNNIINLLSFLIIIIVVALWSTTILIQWGVDFGVYYTGSYFLDENYRLYKEFFTHKGPLYYLFLQSIGYVIGWGYWQAYISFSFSILFFYLSMYYILISEHLKPTYILATCLLSLCLLYNQDTNSSISFFQSGFLITSFWFLAKHKKSFLLLTVSFLLLIFAILTRIDALIYLPIYLIAFIFINNDNSAIKCFQNIIIWFLIIISSFGCLLIYYNFSISEYIQHNLLFNQWYALKLSSCHSLLCTMANFILRPISFNLLTGSLLILPILSLAPQIMSSLFEIYTSIKGIMNKLSLNKNFSSNTYILLLIILSLISWFLTGSDKNYHFLIVMIPLFFFYIMNLNIFKKEKIIFLILISLYCLMTILYTPLYKIYKDPECLYSPFCSSSKINKFKNSINFIESLPGKEVTIVGGNGWIYFYSNKKPSRSINDLWLYVFDSPFQTLGLITQHEKLNKMPPGSLFLVNNKFVNRVSKNKLINQILLNSKLLNRNYEYSTFEKIK